MAQGGALVSEGVFNREVTRRLNEALAHVFNEYPDLYPRREMPRYRYWRLRAAKGRSERTFEYTTGKALDVDGLEPERYWAIERRWVKKAGGREGRIIRRMGFATRRKAKARAYAWYEAARTARA